MKGPNLLYDPRHYDQFLSPIYGGFSDPLVQAAGGGVSVGAAGSSLTASQLSSSGHHGSNSVTGGSVGGQTQRNPYFQSPSIPSSINSSNLAAASRRSTSSRNQYVPISTLTTHRNIGSSGGTSSGGGFGNHPGHHGSHSHNHHHHSHSSGLISPLNGPISTRTSYNPIAGLIDDPQTDLFAPDFGTTFSGAADSINAIPWSSARSYGSSRRSSTSGTAGGGGLDLFSPIGQDIDWLNYPGMINK